MRDVKKEGKEINMWLEQVKMWFCQEKELPVRSK